jgi:hypothetical protein
VDNFTGFLYFIHERLLEIMAKAVKVKTLTLEAGPKGIIQPGTVLELDPKEATAKVKSGYAIYVKEDGADGEDDNSTGSGTGNAE